jgi:hypothetical protein
MHHASLNESVEHEMEEEDKMGHHHPLVMLTKTHTGHIAKLHTVGDSLDSNLMVKDAKGQLKAGVGIRLQQESRWGIYVAGLTPNGPAEKSGKIAEDDTLVSVDGYRIEPEDTLETVRQRVLGPPGTTVVMTFQREDKQGATIFKVSLVRAAAESSSMHELERNLNAAHNEIDKLKKMLKEALEEGDVVIEKNTGRVQRAAPRPPPIDPKRITDLETQLAQAKRLVEDLKTANTSLSGEYTRMQAAAKEAENKHVREQEGSRQLIRELKEQQISLTTNHAKEMNSQQVALQNVMREIREVNEEKAALVANHKKSLGALQRQIEQLEQNNTTIAGESAAHHRFVCERPSAQLSGCVGAHAVVY